jgi:hypothetical protein
VNIDWRFVGCSLVLIILDAIFRKRILHFIGRVFRKLDWFVYERPVLRRLEREEREKEEKERVICTHVGPYR